MTMVLKRIAGPNTRIEAAMTKATVLEIFSDYI